MCRKSLIMKSDASYCELGSYQGINQLDTLARLLEYLPLTTAAMRQAAMLWARARQRGQPTAGDQTIDGDMILAGQALTLGVADVIIATTNVGHLARFAPAELWPNIHDRRPPGLPRTPPPRATDDVARQGAIERRRERARLEPFTITPERADQALGYLQRGRQ